MWWSVSEIAIGNDHGVTGIDRGIRVSYRVEFTRDSFVSFFRAGRVIKIINRSG